MKPTTRIRSPQWRRSGSPSWSRRMSGSGGLSRRSRFYLMLPGREPRLRRMRVAGSCMVFGTRWTRRWPAVSTSTSGRTSPAAVQSPSRLFFLRAERGNSLVPAPTTLISCPGPQGLWIQTLALSTSSRRSGLPSRFPRCASGRYGRRPLRFYRFRIHGEGTAAVPGAVGLSGQDEASRSDAADGRDALRRPLSGGATHP